MATVTKRGNAYQIRVSCGYNAAGKHIMRSHTWKPEPGMTAKQIEDALEKETQRFEDSLKKPDYEKDLIESIFLDAFGVDFGFVVEAVKQKIQRARSIENSKPGKINFGGKAFDTMRKEIVSANCLYVEAGTTGFMGGDSGHGGRTYIEIKDLSSTDIKVLNLKDENGFQIVLGGDTELQTIFEAFEFVLSVLCKQEKGLLEV